MNRETTRKTPDLNRMWKNAPCLFAAWGAVCAVCYALEPFCFGKDFPDWARFGITAAGTALVCVFLLVLSGRFEKMGRRVGFDALTVSLAMMALSLLLQKEGTAAAVCVFGILSVLIAARSIRKREEERLKADAVPCGGAAMRDEDKNGEKTAEGSKSEGPLGFWLAASAAALLQFTVIAVFTVLRVKIFVSPNFDFGIFVNLFHYMKTTGLPLTTCERAGLLSHFAVHFSPILYLLLPFYALFPSPVTLQVLQAALLASGVLPLMLLARRESVPRPVCALLAFACALSPILSGGCFYDFHENAFLFPLLLWLFYFDRTDRKAGLALCAVLLLCVKEDAALYLFVYGLYCIVTKPKQKRGWLMTAGALLWFAGACLLLETAGEGVMTTRYALYGKTPLAMLITLLTRPQTALIAVSAWGKLRYAAVAMLPLGLLPLWGEKRPADALLLLPSVVMNLMTGYRYQYDWFFHYGFGTFAFLLLLTVIGLSRLCGAGQRAGKRSARLAVLLSAGMVLVSGFCFSQTVWSEKSGLIGLYRTGREENRIIEDAMASVPKDASVTASVFYLPPLADRDVIYEIGEAPEETEYYVLDLRLDGEVDEIFEEFYASDDYELTEFSAGLIAVFRYAPSDGAGILQ